MKIKFSVVCLLELLLLSLTSCVNGNVGDDIDFRIYDDNCINTRNVQEYPYTIDEDKIFLAEHGYDTTSMVIYDEYYIVDSKYRIKKSVLLADRALLNSRYSGDELGKDKLHAHYQKIFLSVSSQMFGMVQYVDDAVEAWNESTNCNIRFQTDATIQGLQESKYSTTVNVDFRIQPIAGYELLNFTPSSIISNEKPVESIEINVSHDKWDYLNGNSYQIECLIEHALGVIVGLPIIENMEEYEDPYTIMKSDNSITEASGGSWFGISPIDANKLEEKYPILNYEFKEEWHPIIPTSNILDSQTMYTLVLQDANCCTSQSFWQYSVSLSKGTKDVTSRFVTPLDSGKAFQLRISEYGQYTLIVRALDRNLQVVHCKEFTLYVPKCNFIYTATDMVNFDEEYTFRFDYWHPNHLNPSVNVSITEEMFGLSDSEDNFSVTYNQAELSCDIAISCPGCYFVRIDLMDGNKVLDTRLCNITKMIRVPETTTISYASGSSNITPYIEGNTAYNIEGRYFYDIRFGNIEDYERFACIVESEYENRNGFSEDGVYQRRIDRQWHRNLYIFRDNVLKANAKYSLPTLYFKTSPIPTEEGFERWKYEYYTGYVYCPLDGVREVEDKVLYKLPLQEVYTQIDGGEQRVSTSFNGSKTYFVNYL